MGPGHWRPLGAATAGLVLGLTGGWASVAKAEPTTPAVMYLVRLADEPVAGYAGGRPGLAATRPRHGARLDPANVAVRRYADYLDQRRRAVLRLLPGVRPVYRYRWTVNGFAAALTPDQLAAVRQTPGVGAVARDAVHALDSVPSHHRVGAVAWRALGGIARAGSGVVIGVVDSGIWPDHPSFAGPRPAPAHPFHGGCVAGFRCTGAVIGARWYLDGLGTDSPVRAEYRSPLDYDGHGTYVAAVAGGDEGVPAAIGPQLRPTLGTVAGVAPAARLAVYKSCWAVTGGESCADSDSVAAIDQAVADGVDVLNVSIGGAAAGMPSTDPLTAALYGAAEAGVFVATSVGNDGPAAGTAHGQPWLTTVGAGTYDRRPVAAVRLGDGTRLSGAGLGVGVASRPLVAGDGGAAKRCEAGSLDRVRTRGRIVVCLRGGNARAAKSMEVARVGGVGMILANRGLEEVEADLQAVPTVHVGSDAYRKLTTYLKTRRPTAALEPARMRLAGPDASGRPEVAEFSARGPDGDVLAPDLMAPGVDVLAAASPARDGSEFALRSGTSVATPQVAGAAALLRGRYPGWSPMAVKSALLTTALTRDAHGTPIATVDAEIAGPAEYGAGALDVPRAVDPGLVFDSAAPNWTGATAVNSPAVAIGALAGVRTVGRTVTNVGTTATSYLAKVDAPPGVDVSVRPSRLTLRPGQSATFAVTVNRISAPYDQLAVGSITWTDGEHTVRMPVAVRPVVVTAGGGGLGGTLRIVPGFSGRLRARLSGPVPAVAHTGWVRPAGARFAVDVPRGTALARFATTASDFPPGADVDLYIYRNGSLVGRSLGRDAAEQVDLHNPIRGTYEVSARLILAPGRGRLPARVDSYVVPREATGQAAVLPGDRGVKAGMPALVRLDWPGRPPRGRWLGQVQWSDGGTGEAVTTLTL